MAAALEPLRARLGADAPSLAELVKRGAEALVRELEAQDRGRSQTRATFVERMRAAGPPDVEEIDRIRHAARRP